MTISPMNLIILCCASQALFRSPFVCGQINSNQCTEYCYTLSCTEAKAFVQQTASETYLLSEMYDPSCHFLSDQFVQLLR
jgi:hypothetical protein